jgi:hypothetical protein
MLFPFNQCKNADLDRMCGRGILSVENKMSGNQFCEALAMQGMESDCTWKLLFP